VPGFTLPFNISASDKFRRKRSSMEYLGSPYHLIYQLLISLGGKEVVWSTWVYPTIYYISF